MNSNYNSPVRIVGLYNWHDGGYCVLEDGVITQHIEFERYNRTKASGGDSLKYLSDIFLRSENLNIADIDHWVSPSPNTNLELGGTTRYNTHTILPKDKITFYSHHLCHAAHAYFSSPYNDALVLTIDSAGLDNDGKGYSTTGYACYGSELKRIMASPEESFSLGNLWSKLTRFIFKLSPGYPLGCQAGTIMAMAAMGKPDKFYIDISRMLHEDFKHIRHLPIGAPRGLDMAKIFMNKNEEAGEVFHPYLNKFRKLAEEDEQEKFNIAASLQKVTEDSILALVDQLIDESIAQGFKTENLCLAGGVSLNSVAMGKINKNMARWGFKNIFVPPVPYDGGLNIGACQYHWHSVLGMPRNGNEISPYLGENYSVLDIEEALKAKNDQLIVSRNVSVTECAQLLVQGNIVSIFQGCSESGRRALGNRSILANPSIDGMKDLINQKVKHRQWYRPFAPSILEEYGKEWFEDFFPSPYMGFVFDIKNDKKGIAKAIEHVDGTARVQSVNKNQNEVFYNFIIEFYKLSGIPLVLNTSFNDREPICETAEHAINCFLRTHIDYLYFFENKTLVSRKSLNRI